VRVLRECGRGLEACPLEETPQINSMKAAVIAVICLVSLGSAEARLGESEDECRKRYVKLLDFPIGGLADASKYYARATTDLRRDTIVVLIFDRKTEQCVSLSHSKSFKKDEDMNLPFRAIEGILEDNFGSDLSNLKRRAINHPNKKWNVDGPEDREYTAGWESPDGLEDAYASSEPKNGGYEFYVTCSSQGFFKEQSTYYQNRYRISKE
jgi:hypothetical protein